MGEKIKQGKVREGHALEFFMLREAEDLAKKRIKRDRRDDQLQAYRTVLAASGYHNQKTV